LPSCALHEERLMTKPLRPLFSYRRGVIAVVLQPTVPAIEASVAVPPKLRRMEALEPLRC